MTKRILSVILAVILALSAATIAVSAQTDIAATGDNVDGKIYFDANSAGWNTFDKIAFHIWAIDDEDFVPFDWGGKKQDGVNEGDGVWSYDLSKVGGIKPDCQYVVIFYSKVGGSAVMQTYNLLFGAECIGKTAACDGTVYENPEDSEKTAQAAFWGEGIDPAVYGPEMKVTSIGNVVGTCPPKGVTKVDLFDYFLVERLDNARTFSLKEDQKLIDDVASDLGLTADEVKEELEKTDVSSAWQYDSSTLEKKPVDPIPVPSGSVILFDCESAGWMDASYIGFHIWEVGKDPFFEWGEKNQRGTRVLEYDDEGAVIDTPAPIWQYDLAEHGITLEEDKHYGVVFYDDKGDQTYNLLFDTTCIGDTAYCADDAVLENPVDSDKETKVAYWKHQDPTVNGPEMIVTTIGTVVGFCIPKNSSAFDLFLDFLLYNLEIAETYSGLTQQVLIENVARDLELTVEDVEDAIRIAGVEVNWNPSWSELAHKELVPGEPDRVPLTVDVAEGDGTAKADKKYLTVNYSLPPEYAYDTVTLTAEPAEGYLFVNWQIEGKYEIDGNYSKSSDVLPIKAFGSISAHAVFISAYDWDLRGDYDADGEVTILDATRAQRMIAELDKKPDAAILTTIDADRDGELTILDATRIQRVLAELCDWDGNPIGQKNPDELPFIPA